MKTAIITGATGLVGSAVARHLSKQDVQVLCLGRKPLTEAEVVAEFGAENIYYLAIPMEEIVNLPRGIEEVQWSPGDSCVFYHFAWRGAEKLTDGNFRHQFINATHTANAVVAAKRVGCTKFVTAGTMEETFAETYLSTHNISAPYESAQTDYAIAKLAARDMSKVVAYLEKIDYVHTRLSVPIDQSLNRGGYVGTTIRKILRREPYQLPSNPSLFDIITTLDVAEAYLKIGHYGRNKADYFIGTSRPKTLRQFFQICERIRDGGYQVADGSDDSVPHNELFSIKNLVEDTGFRPSVSYEELIKSRVHS